MSLFYMSIWFFQNVLVIQEKFEGEFHRESYRITKKIYMSKLNIKKIINNILKIL